MKLKSILVAGAIALAAQGALATDATFALTAAPGGTYTGFFGETHTTGAFTDTLTFTPNLGGFASSVISSIALGAGDLTLNSISLNGQAFSKVATGLLELQTFGSTVNALTMVINGTVLSANASYAGVLNLSPVPEPSSYALMLAGVAIIGGMKLRKAKANA